MIKTLIKHKLIEFAINNIFDQIQYNFSDVHIPRLIIYGIPLRVVRESLNVKTRTLGAKYTLEPQQDIQASPYAGDIFDSMQSEIEDLLDKQALGDKYDHNSD